MIEATERSRRAVELVTEAGKTLLENGGEVFRAQQTMEIMARALAVEDFHVYVLTNGIFVSAGEQLHEVRHIPAVTMHLARVEAVNALSRRLAAGQADLDDAEQALAAARALPNHDPRLQFVAGLVGAGCFGYLFGGGAWDIALAALAAAAEMIVQRGLPKITPGRHVSRLFLNIAASCVGALVAMLLCLALGCPGGYATATIAALMLLTPGVSLTMAVSDLVHADYLSGTIRLFDALLVAGSLACGVGVAWLVYSGVETLLPAAAVAVTVAAGYGQWVYILRLTAHFALAMLSTVCFAVTFQVPRRHYLACGVTGAVGWLAYLLLTGVPAFSAPAATLLAVLPLTALARWFARRHCAPMTLFLLCGIFPLVPGAGIYHTAYAFLQGDQAGFAGYGAQTLQIAIALALGIALVCGVPLPPPKGK